MRIYTALLVSLSFIVNSIAYAGPSCDLMFSPGSKQAETAAAGEMHGPPAPPIIRETLKSNSNRVELVKLTNSAAPEKVTVEVMEFSKNTDEASIEVMRMLLQNSSYILEEKNVLTKGELVIGLPAKDGYYFEVTYKSMSGERSQFIVDKISLKTPTGSESKKIAEGFLRAGEVKLKKTEFEIGNILGAGVEAKLKIPLIIDGPLLNKIDKLARFFEFFKKDEMRKLLQSNSMLKIRTVFEYRRAKDVFFKVLLKEPMKAAIGMGFIILASGVSNLPVNMLGSGPEPVGQQVTVMAPRETATYLQSRINQMAIPSTATALKAEVVALNAQIKSHYTSQEVYTGPKLAEVLMSQNPAFSTDHQTFVMEKVDPMNKSIHTYLVFAQEKVSVDGPGLQYMIMEIDAAKYPELIKVLKTQVKINSVTQAPAKVN